MIQVNSSSKFSVLVTLAFTEKGKRQQQVEQTHNFLVSILVFARVTYLFCDSMYVHMLRYGELKSTTSYVLLIVKVMSTSNFEYE